MKKLIALLFFFAAPLVGQSLGVCSVDPDKRTGNGGPLSAAQYDELVTAAEDMCVLNAEDWPTACTDGQGLLASSGAMVCSAVEGDTHASEHAENAADELLAENLGTACTTGQIVVSDGSGGLDCADHSEGRVLVDSEVASGSSSVELTGIDGTYDRYVLELDGITVSVDNAEILLQVGDGTSIKTSTYSSYYQHIDDAGNEVTEGSSAATAIYLTSPTAGNGIDSGASTSSRNFTVYIVGFSGTAFYKAVRFDTFGSLGNALLMTGWGGGAWKGGAGALTRVQITPSSGTFSGTIKLWGLPSS